MASASLDLPQCCIGKILNKDCHEGKFTKFKKIKCFDELTKEDQELVYLQCKVNHIKTICYHHKKIFLNRFESSYDGSICCNPFNKHKIKIKKSVRVISVAKEFDLIPGHKLCTECRKILYLKNN
nr:ARL14 effector protein-like [Hydra vulgaris]